MGVGIEARFSASESDGMTTENLYSPKWITYLVTEGRSLLKEVDRLREENATLIKERNDLIELCTDLYVAACDEMPGGLSLSDYKEKVFQVVGEMGMKAVMFDFLADGEAAWDNEHRKLWFYEE
jgi:hypothetical protein